MSRLVQIRQVSAYIEAMRFFQGSLDWTISQSEKETDRTSVPGIIPQKYFHQFIHHNLKNNLQIDTIRIRKRFLTSSYN